MPKVISFTHKGNFEKTDRLFHNIIAAHYRHKLAMYGERGVRALQSATPLDTGKTADAWSNNINDGVNIAVILQYGHGTRNGGYVEGIDYINPTLRPIFQEMADAVWKEVVSS